MSALASNPAKNRFSTDLAYPSLEVVRLAPEWRGGLQQFFKDLNESGDDVFFSPHPTDVESIRRVAAHDGKDIYYLLIEQGKTVGYGMLRGWDEGYQIPSLGLAIHPSVRGQGLGKMLMGFLHLQAFRRGAEKVRLRVNSTNDKALKLYKGLGYVFEEDPHQVDLLVGFKDLGTE